MLEGFENKYPQRKPKLKEILKSFEKKYSHKKMKGFKSILKSFKKK